MKSILFLLLGYLIPFQYLTAKVYNPPEKPPVDYVNPYISHLLVPTYPTVHLPNSMLRVYPERENYTGNKIHGLALIVTSHRGSSAFNLSPYQGKLSKAASVISYGYNNEVVTPYYSVDLDDEEMFVQYAPSHQSGIYEINFSQTEKPAYLIFNTRNGELKTDGKCISGYQKLGNQTQVYIYLETDRQPLMIGTHEGNSIHSSENSTQGHNAYPYLYNYAGQPWRTQKRVRNLLTKWFRNDLMGIPGDDAVPSSFVM